MERHYFGLSTLLASVALLIWSIGETFAYPQGPNVSMGSNPVVSFVCNSTPYVVPTNMDLIITDLVATSGYDATISKNGTALTLFHAWSGGNGYHTFATGYKAESASSITCSRTLYISGYLVHQ